MKELLILAAILTAGLPAAAPASEITLAGARSSHYGVKPFPAPEEWVRSLRESENPGWGQKVDDATARPWEARVRAHEPEYVLFLKHWDLRWMPPSYRGDLVFVDDSQQLDDLEAMADELAVWGQTFAPNPVAFQGGYEADGRWWRPLRDPLVEVGKGICDRIEQRCDLYWVDFTLWEALPDDVLGPGR